ncbi:MAG TPA: AsmA family protein, partial [Alphaproteobacteria bacterium]|nr:AsmA family protein [Alphaproteobacteria bacterium]
MEQHVRKILIGFAVTLTLILLAALIVPSFIDWNRFKAEIESQARLATGRELTIGGDISFSVLPAPTLAVADVALANIPGASET